MPDTTPAQPVFPGWAWLHEKSPHDDRLEMALRTRGLYTCRDASRSWHAAQAGIPVIEVRADAQAVTVQRVSADVDVARFIPSDDAPCLRIGGLLDVEQVANRAAELVDRRITGSGAAGRYLDIDPRNVRTLLSKDPPQFPPPDDYQMRGSIRQPVWYASTLDAWPRRSPGRPPLSRDRKDVG